MFQELTPIFILCLWRKLYSVFSRKILKIQFLQTKRWSWPCSPSQPFLPFCSPGHALLHYPISNLLAPMPRSFPSTLAGTLHITVMTDDSVKCLSRHFSIFCVHSHLTFRTNVDWLFKKKKRTKPENNKKKKENLEMLFVFYSFLWKMKALLHFRTQHCISKDQIQAN